jgi:PPM family protein phosphatase
MFQEKLEAWLSRTVPERALNQYFDLPAVLATDMGLQRSENQDRVGALRIGAKASGGRALIAIAVADGMGGLLDGGKCATLALSSFFFALILYRNHQIERRALSAISHANDVVFRFAGGKGGTTLSAVVLDNELRPLIVHLGDSRVYSFGVGAKVQRLTVDDSLAEAVGGHGRDLLQFVGMGAGMQPHVRSIPDGIRHLAITTDGIHFIESATLESILLHAVELKSASERLSAVARWCGGPDNASSALFDLPLLMQEVRRGERNGIQLWDPFGTLTTIWVRGETDKQAEVIAQENIAKQENAQPQKPQPKHKKVKSPPKKPKKVKKGQEDFQLDIQVERSAGSEDTDDSSR